MKSNNKGFTLVELIAVIVVLSFLITIASTIFVNVRQSVLNGDYNNIISYLESKALEYANKTDINNVSVETLIKEGYVNPDNETDIYDPRDNTTLNCYVFKTTFEDNKYVISSIVESKPDKNNKCTFNEEQYFEICNYNETTGICERIDGTKWYSENMNLRVKYKNDLLSKNEKTTFLWKSNTGLTSEDEMVEINVEDNTYRIYYTSAIELIDQNVSGIANKYVKIDKEPPIITNIKKQAEADRIKVTPVATDGNGSGVYGFSKPDSNGDCSSDKKVYNKEPFEYAGEARDEFFCVMDNVGNYAKFGPFTIDNKKPTISSKGNQEIEVGENKEISDYFDWKCNGEDYSDQDNCEVSCDYSNTKDLTVGEKNITCTVTRNNGNSASASVNIDVIPIAPDKPNVTTYYTKTTDFYNGTLTNKDIDFKITRGGEKIVTEYQYKVGDNTNWIKVTPDTNYNGSFTFDEDFNGKIYIKACCSTKKHEKCSESVEKKVNIDKTPSTPNVITYYENTNNIYDGTWTNKSIDFKITPGKKDDLITKYQYKVGVNGQWIDVSDNGLFTYGNDVNSKIYIRAYYKDSKSTRYSGEATKDIKIDKTNPTCSLSASGSNVSVVGKDNNLDSSGISTSNTASYNTKSLSISSGVFYGFVKDKAGNTGECSMTFTNATTKYNKTTTTCEEDVTEKDYYDCYKSLDSCTSGWENCTYCKTDKCRKSTVAVSKTYTRTSKKCLREATQYTCSKSATYCGGKNSKTACQNAGCYWKAVALGGGSCYASSSSVNQYKCSDGSLNGSTCYKYKQSSCPSGWSKTATSYSYYWSSTSTNSASSCSSNTFNCNSSNFNSTYVSCSDPKYSCSSGTYPNSGSYCYTYGGYNGCSSGTKSGSSCYLYDRTSCSSGWSKSFSHTEYTYKYSPSSTTDKNLTTCTPSTGYSASCSGSSSSRKTNIANKVNVTCSSTTTCPSGYKLVSNSTSYCYK